MTKSITKEKKKKKINNNNTTHNINPPALPKKESKLPFNLVIDRIISYLVKI